MEIDYTSRDFAALKTDLINLIKAKTNTSWNPTDYSDLGNVLVESFAYMGDIMSHYLDRIANETSIDTAIKTSTLLNFANLYDYIISGPTPSTVYVTFTNGVNSTSSYDIPIGTQVIAPLSYGPFAQVYFETVEAATALAPGASITLLCEEGKTVNTDRPDQIDSNYNKALPANLGTSNGSEDQTFLVYDYGLVNKSLTVYVGQGTAFSSWSYVDNLLEYGPTDKVFTVVRDAEGFVSVVFGDGVNGAIPAANQLISAVYKSSVGAAGNIKSLLINEVTFIPGNLDIQVPTLIEVSNSLPSSGGADADTFEQLRKKVKAAIGTRKRAVTLQDYADLALMVPQVGKAKASSNVYSLVNLYIQGPNDLTPAPGYLQAKNIVSASGNGTTVTYTCKALNPHGLSVGDVITISGMYLTAYNLTNAVVASVPTDLTFTVTNAATGTWVTVDAEGRTGLAIKTQTGSNPALTNTWNNIATDLTRYFADKTPAGISLNILPPSYVPIYLKYTATVDPAYKESDIKLAVYQAMLGPNGMFEYNNNTFGDSIPLSVVTAAIQNIPGILSVVINKLNTDDGSSAATISLLDPQIPFLTASSLTAVINGGIE
jgi:hypothetical protein